MPVVVHSSPALILPAQDYSGVQGQIRYASKLLSGILDYKTMIDE
jgi:carnitine O-acetyltransferase